jgi:hypothetical protein
VAYPRPNYFYSSLGKAEAWRSEMTDIQETVFSGHSVFWGNAVKTVVRLMTTECECCGSTVGYFCEYYISAVTKFIGRVWDSKWQRTGAQHSVVLFRNSDRFCVFRRYSLVPAKALLSLSRARRVFFCLTLMWWQNLLQFEQVVWFLSLN